MENLSLLEAYLTGPHTIRTAIAGMTQQQLLDRPIPGKWSVLEVVCHLADAEANIAHRIKRVLAEEQPEFDRFKPDLMQAALSYHGRDAAEELMLIDFTRRQIARIL